MPSLSRNVNLYSAHDWVLGSFTAVNKQRKQDSCFFIHWACDVPAVNCHSRDHSSQVMSKVSTLWLPKLLLPSPPLTLNSRFRGQLPAATLALVVYALLSAFYIYTITHSEFNCLLVLPGSSIYQHKHSAQTVTSRQLPWKTSTCSTPAHEK